MVPPGSDVSMKCHSDLPPTWWRERDNKMYTAMLATLVLKNITRQDGGRYLCKGHLDEFGYMPFTAISTLLVAGLFLNVYSYTAEYGNNQSVVFEIRYAVVTTICLSCYDNEAPRVRTLSWYITGYKFYTLQT